VPVLELLAVALAGANAVLLLVLAARRVALMARERRRAGIEQRLKPALVGFLHSGAPLPEALPDHEQEVLADLLARYARLLRGPLRDRITAQFAELGTVAREQATLRGHRVAWRRAAAAYRLGDIAGPGAIPSLIEALQDPSREVRTAAVRSLGRLGDPIATRPLLEALAEGRVPGGLARWALLQLGSAATPELRALLDAAEPEQRAGAVQLLGRLGDASDAGSVEARLRDTSALVRVQAAEALGRLGSSRHIAALLRALEDRVPAVRAAAAAALGALRDPLAVPALLERAGSDTFEVAGAAAQALAELDPQLAATGAEQTTSQQLREAADLAMIE
jgi:HEAT repeat protein